MPSYVILSEKPWNADLADNLSQRLGGDWHHLSELSTHALEAIGPEFVFVPHWSRIIASEIYESWPCVVFHMTDLPYGRGGTPLQNLIVRGHRSTMMSAIAVVEEVDAGPVYLKKPLSLEGSAQEIYLRASGVIESMIEEIVRKRPEPQPQSGAVVTFARRRPAESDLAGLADLDSVFDHIRMLDADGYPHAFLEGEGLRVEFSGASRAEDGSIRAHARIVSK
jgi:methionyl-tRNA formyltransferase